MRDTNLGWMCQRVLGREREGHGGCLQHWNGGQGISCRLPGPLDPGRERPDSAGLSWAPQPTALHLTRPGVRPVSLQTPGEDTGVAQLPRASSQLGVRLGTAAACRSPAMATAGLAARRAIAAARLFLIISVFAQSGLITGSAQQSSPLLRVPDRVSEYLLKCFTQYSKHIWTGCSSSLASSCCSEDSHCFFCFHCCSLR